MRYIASNGTHQCNKGTSCCFADEININAWSRPFPPTIHIPQGSRKRKAIGQQPPTQGIMEPASLCRFDGKHREKSGKTHGPGCASAREGESDCSSLLSRVPEPILRWSAGFRFPRHAMKNTGVHSSQERHLIAFENKSSSSLKGFDARLATSRLRRVSKGIPSRIVDL